MTVDGKTEKKWPVYYDSRRIMLGDRMKLKGATWTVRSININDVGESLVIAQKDGSDSYDPITALQCAVYACKLNEAFYYDGKKVAVGDWYVDPRELSVGISPALHCVGSATIDKLGGRTDLLPEKLFACGDGGYVKTGETYYGGDNTRWKVLGYNTTEKQGHIVRVESVADPNKKRDVKAKWLEHNYHNSFYNICRDMNMNPMTYCINFGLRVDDPTDSMLWNIKDRMRRCRDGQ